ncbi:MAG: GTPase HflX [Bacteroidales bacterium]|nr:GTPase HflX [Clostridium sp.]MCM1204427.1 GTPase HflX [Bacteroidales bacterium]
MAQFFEQGRQEERVILTAVTERGSREEEESFLELKELVKTAGAVCVGTLCQNLEYANPVTYLGKGKLEELKTMLVASDATGIVCDTELTPVQMKNLSQLLEVKIMDRTMIILDIFAARANTREGKIQVELAQLKYNATMLVGLRQSLSRLGGGIGTRGPGEKKLEMDRRLIREQISRLKRELNEVKKHRETQRKRRSGSSNTVVCIVGYTNAGKSTLLNFLTQSEVLAEDKLFATLDPVTRSMKLPGGSQIMLTDTVGFISKLPHHLIQAFRSTLEEAKYSDIILHVVDASNPDMDRQMFAVYETLQQLGIADKPVLTVFNKIDRLQELPVLKDLRADAAVFASAKSGQGIAELLHLIEQKIRENKVYVERLVAYQDTALLAEVRSYGELLSEEYKEDGIYIKAYVRKQDAERLCRD